jgi:hypothetical protein
MDTYVVHYSLINNDLPKNNQFRLKGYLVKVNCIGGNMLNVFEQIYLSV